MAGRGLYDNQMVIRATNKIESDTIQIIPDNKVNILAGGSLLVQIIPDEKTIMKLESLWISIPSPGVGTSGNYIVRVIKRAGGVGVVMFYAMMAHNGTIDMIANKLVTANAISLFPSTSTEVLTTITSLINATFDDNAILEIDITNNTNAEWVNKSALINIAVNNQAVA